MVDKVCDPLLKKGRECWHAQSYPMHYNAIRNWLQVRVQNFFMSRIVSTACRVLQNATVARSLNVTSKRKWYKRNLRGLLCYVLVCILRNNSTPFFFVHTFSRLDFNVLYLPNSLFSPVPNRILLFYVIACICLLVYYSRAIAEAVSRRSLTADAGVRFLVDPCNDLWWARWFWHRFFSWVHWCSLVRFIPLLFHILWCFIWTQRESLTDAVSYRHSLTPSQQWETLSCIYTEHRPRRRGDQGRLSKRSKVSFLLNDEWSRLNLNHGWRRKREKSFHCLYSLLHYLYIHFQLIFSVVPRGLLPRETFNSQMHLNSYLLLFAWFYRVWCYSRVPFWPTSV
jgi:hypothetical protein